jgi:hypothetical protein
MIRNLYSAFTIDTSTPTSTPNLKKHPLSYFQQTVFTELWRDILSTQEFIVGLKHSSNNSNEFILDLDLVHVVNILMRVVVLGSFKFNNKYFHI